MSAGRDGVERGVPKTEESAAHRVSIPLAKLAVTAERSGAAARVVLLAAAKSERSLI